MKKIFLRAIITVFLFINLVSASNIGLIENSTWEQNLTAVRFSATAFGDLNNDAKTDLILTGCTSGGALSCGGVIAKIYLNNGTTLTENQTWQQNLSGVGHSSLALGDIDNDGDLDLVLTGCDSASDMVTCDGNHYAKIYINNGTSLVENSQWGQNLTGVFIGSNSFGDIDNDGDLDLILTGKSETTFIAKIYINNGTTLTESSTWQGNLTAGRSGSAILGDIDNDNDLDLYFAGYDGSSWFSNIYLNNGTSFVGDSVWSQSFGNWGWPENIFGDYDNDGDLDLIRTGTLTGDHLWTYRNNGSTFIVSQKNSGDGGDLGGGLYDSCLAFGDYDNDGDLDFVAMGREARRNAIYENNESKNYNFSIDSIAGKNFEGDDMHDGSLAWLDMDNDNNLDLIAVGTNTSVGLFNRTYISNASLTKNNSQSSPPNTFTSDYLDGVLNLTWNSGSDDDTPSTGLYYNLMVGNSTDNHTVVSGVYGGSSNPTAGYFGNMMQRKEISLNKYLSDDTYYWYVQTIDTGLRKSNWSARQSIVIGADASVPNISSVSSSVTSSTATITWTTNESANSTVHYGTTTSTTSSSSLDDLALSHSIGLTGLSASTLYYYNVTSCDYWNNCNTSIQYTFTTSAAPVTPPGGGSPGGSGPSGGTTTPITPTIPEFDVDFSASTMGIFDVNAGDIKTFSFQGEVEHSITALTVTSNSITLLIASDPITIQILLGETKQIDMNKDGINDLEIKLNSIISGKANFLITKLEGADIVGEEELGKEALFDVKVSLSNLFGVVKSGREIIASIEVLNVNNIGQVDVIVDYYITDRENTTLAQGSDTLAVEAVASFVRTLTVPYNVKSGKYLFNVNIKYGDEIMASGNTEFKVVKSYWIIIAVSAVILIVAGIFFYLWKIKRKEEKLEKKEARLERIVSKLRIGKKKRRKRKK